MEHNIIGIHEESKYELNQEEVARLTPLLIYMSLIGLCGIPGNSLVIYAFKDSCRTSNSHLFFVWLAIIDLFNCSVILPFEFVNVVNQYTYDYAWLCKLTISFTIWPTITSGLTLTVISVDRFRKVCRPLKWQFTNRTARILCAATLLIGFLFSWPALIIFGLHEFEITPHNVTGTDCAITNEFEGSLYMRIYNGFLWILFMSTISVLIVLYVIIGRQIFRQTSKVNKLTRSESEHGRMTSTITKPTNENVTEDTISSTGDTTSPGMSFGRTSSSGGMLDEFSVSLAVDKKYSTICDQNIERKVAKSEARARKSAMIMFFISLAFIISYLPYLILRLLEGITFHFVISMTDTERALYKSFLRSYWLNCAINPFIYCACAPQFRRKLKGLWSKIKRRG